MTFKVGDRVVRKPDQYLAGLVATVRWQQGGELGLEFDEYVGGHSLDNRCKMGHGWWTAACTVQLVRPPPANEFERALFGYIDQELPR